MATKSKFSPAVGTSTNQKSRTPAYISGNKPKSHRPSYHHDDKQTDKRLQKPPVRKPGTSLGAGKQDNIFPAGQADLQKLQKKQHDNTKRVLPVPIPAPQKGKLIETVDGQMPKK